MIMEQESGTMMSQNQSTNCVQGQDGQSINNKMLSEQEAALYDRQIRLWGLEAQKQLRGASVLFIGLGSAAPEIVKTLTLAGVNQMTIWDHEQVTIKDSMTHLFVNPTNSDLKVSKGSSRVDESKDTIQSLNPMVKIVTQQKNILQLLESPNLESLKSELVGFSAIVLVGATRATATKLNLLIRSLDRDIPFYFVTTFGMFGFSFLDAGQEFKFRTKEQKVQEADLEGDESAKDVLAPKSKKAKMEHSNSDDVMIEKKMTFCSLDQALSIKCGKAGHGLTKRTNPLFLVLHILLEFQEVTNRRPERASEAEDLKLLDKIEQQVIERLGLPEEHFVKKLKETKYQKWCFGDLSPITTVLGGIVGQDAIRVMTHSGIPIRNFFLFSGFAIKGFVESIPK